MKRISIFLVGILLVGAIIAALAGARIAPPPARQALFHTVELRRTKLGRILVNSAGSILYEFAGDPRNRDTCVKVSGCQAIWLAMPVQGRPSAGPGVRASLLSRIPIAGGIEQVTYAGHPLYLYSAAPTATSYVGTKAFGGRWYALNAKGQAVR